MTRNRCESVGEPYGVSVICAERHRPFRMTRQVAAYGLTVLLMIRRTLSLDRPTPRRDRRGGRALGRGLRPLRRGEPTAGRVLPTLGRGVPSVGRGVPTLGRVLRPLRRVLPLIGRVLRPVGRVVPTVGRALRPFGRGLRPVGRALRNGRSVVQNARYPCTKSSVAAYETDLRRLESGSGGRIGYLSLTKSIG